ncbi:hypothetical protein B296_00024341 [Ensete ventricosum]|uniref:Uncharacterized protein n=1 Tax=Ensete ventricosum TaxID=4639 RepID=A0A427AV70_ENSVE|nr:hypothetical protein B296_00024341 [Ensete ventricosum]
MTAVEEGTAGVSAAIAKQEGGNDKGKSGWEGWPVGKKEWAAGQWQGRLRAMRRVKEKAAVRLLLRGLKATDEEMTTVGGEEEGRTEVAGGSPLSRMMLPASFLLFHYLSFLLAVAKMVR